MQGSFVVGRSNIPLMGEDTADAMPRGGKSYLNTSPNFSDPASGGDANENIKLVRLGIKDGGENPLELSQIILAVSENQLDSTEKPKTLSKLADVSRGATDAKAGLAAGQQQLFNTTLKLSEINQISAIKKD